MCTKSEIDEKLKKIINSPVKYNYLPEFDAEGEFFGIRALIFDSVNYHGLPTKVFSYFGIPKGKRKKVPAMVLIHGGGGHAYACWVKLWNDRGYAAIAIDTSGSFPCKKGAGYAECQEDSLNWKRNTEEVFKNKYYSGPDNDEMKSSDCPLEEQWMYHAIAAAITANSFLRSIDIIDKKRIGVSGISWGGIITSLLIGYDLRFCFAVAVYGSGFLGEGLSDLDKIFKNEAVRKLWLAEDNFSNVKIPVLWLAWNDDCCFSIQSNSSSYNATYINNHRTRLVLRDKMMHSHCAGWTPEEIFHFAFSQTLKASQIPDVSVLIEEKQAILSVECESDIKLTLARLYYINEPMRYIHFCKYGEFKNSYMCEQWKTSEHKFCSNKATIELPQECAGFYIEVSYKYKDRNMVVTTEYKQMKG